MGDLSGKFAAAPRAAELTEIFGNFYTLLFRGAARDEEMIDFVARRLKSKHIGNERLPTINSSFLQKLIEQLAAASDEGMTKPDFVGAGRLAHKRKTVPFLGHSRKIIFDFGLRRHNIVPRVSSLK